jgi:hypothetical protein
LASPLLNPASAIGKLFPFVVDCGASRVNINDLGVFLWCEGIRPAGVFLSA